MRLNHQRAVGHEAERVAVGARIRYLCDADGAGCAFAIDDHHRAADPFTEALGEGARGDIDRAACGEGHHEL